MSMRTEITWGRRRASHSDAGAGIKSSKRRRASHSDAGAGIKQASRGERLTAMPGGRTGARCLCDRGAQNQDAPEHVVCAIGGSKK